MGLHTLLQQVLCSCPCVYTGNVYTTVAHSVAAGALLMSCLHWQCVYNRCTLCCCRCFAHALVFTLAMCIQLLHTLLQQVLCSCPVYTGNVYTTVAHSVAAGAFLMPLCLHWQCVYNCCTLCCSRCFAHVLFTLAMCIQPLHTLLQQVLCLCPCVYTGNVYT